MLIQKDHSGSDNIDSAALIMFSMSPIINTLWLSRYASVFNKQCVVCRGLGDPTHPFLLFDLPHYCEKNKWGISVQTLRFDLLFIFRYLVI